MTPPPLIPHRDKSRIVESIVKPAIMKSEKGAWPRELQILNRLIARYPDADFWLGFSIPYELNSLAYFITDKGATVLADAYRLHTFHRAQQISLDTVDKPTRLVEDVEKPVAAKPRVNALDWADSTQTL